MLVKLAAVASALCLMGATGAARAEVLEFSVAYGRFDPGVVETFDIDTSQPGVQSPVAMDFYNQSGTDLDFNITGDSLGNKVLLVGDADDATDPYDFATGTSDNDAFFGNTFTYQTSQHFYNGDSLFINAAAGQTATGTDGTIIAVSAVSAISAAPEPSTWLLMLAGIGGIGLMLRRARKTMGFRLKDALNA